MGQADGRVGLIDVLAACTRGAIGVSAYIGRVDVDFDRIDSNVLSDHVFGAMKSVYFHNSTVNKINNDVFKNFK